MSSIHKSPIVVEIVRPTLPKHKKTTLLPLLWSAFRKFLFAILPKRIYLRHLKKRILWTSIVEIVRPMFPKNEKATLLPLPGRGFRNFLFAIFLKRIYLRHWNKKIMRASIVEIVRPMIPKHENSLIFPMLWRSFRNSFFCYLAPIYLLTTLLNKNNASVDCRNCASDDSKTRKNNAFAVAMAWLQKLFVCFFQAHLLTTLKKKSIGTVIFKN